MKKTILGFAFLAIAAVAGQANAQCPNQANCDQSTECKKEQCDQKKCKGTDCTKQDCKDKKCNPADCKKQDCKDKKCNPADCKKQDCKKQDCKKQDCKKDGLKKFPGRFESQNQCQNAEILKGLNLSDEQKVKVKDLQKAMNASRAEMKENCKGEKGECRENMKEMNKTLRTKYLEDLKNILTPEQYTQFLQNFFITQSPNNKPFPAKVERRIERLDKEAKAKIQEDRQVIDKDLKKAEKDVKKAEKKAEKGKKK